MESRNLSLSWPALIVTVALASSLVNVSIGMSYGIPKPGVHDEFAYLLMGDTFAQGRLTNPTHPMWPHFETYHVFHRPTYQAKYPPAQGMLLALAQIVAGLPILGVWVGLAAACAATCWMLGAVVPRPWAFLGGMLLAVNPHAVGWWGQSYWGGAVAALGGALFFGAVFRFQQRLLLRDSLLMALGVGLLVNSRPFEGLFACLAAAPLIVLGTLRWRKSERSSQWIPRFAIPLGLGLLVVAAWALYYNHRLTGDAFTLPYLNWKPEASAIESIRSYKGPARLSIWTKLSRLEMFYVAPPILWLSMFGLWAIVKQARTRFALLVLLFVAVLGSRFTDVFPHYVAPFACLVSAVVVQGLRSLAGFRFRGRRMGMIVVTGVVIASFAWDALYWKQLLEDGPLKGALPSPRHWDAVFEAPAVMRESMIETLEARPGKDLILVRYEASRYVDRFEWVYNGSDIDAAEVVWARELSEPQNRRLRAYFKHRQVWLLDPEIVPLRLSPLSRTAISPERGEGSQK